MLDNVKNSSSSLTGSFFSTLNSITVEDVNEFVNTSKKVAFGSMASFLTWHTLNNPFPITASTATDLLASAAVIGANMALFDYSSEGLEKTCYNVFLSSIIPLAISYPIIPLCAAYNSSAEFTFGAHSATLLATTILVPMAANYFGTQKNKKN